MKGVIKLDKDMFMKDLYGKDMFAKSTSDKNMHEKDIYKMKMPEYGISPLPADPVPTMAYVPFQNNDKLYSADHGLVIGTMFPVLDKPFKCGLGR